MAVAASMDVAGVLRVGRLLANCNIFSILRSTPRSSLSMSSA
jgi:hypothetical protein